MVSEAPHGAPGASGPRAPLPEARGAAAWPDDALPLRLALARGSLGIELNRPERVGPLQVRELALSLPDLRYPLDLSKGVKQFRSRRGQLQRLVLSLPLAALAEWLEGCLGEHLGEPLLGARLWVIDAEESPGSRREPSKGAREEPSEEPSSAPLGVGVGLFSASRSLAFDLWWCAPEGPRLVLERPRAVGVELSALAASLRAVDRLISGLEAEVGGAPRIAVRKGRIIELGEIAGALCRRILPSYGCRAPATDGVKVMGLEVREGSLELAFDVDHELPGAPRAVLLALEAAYRLRAADDLLAIGDDVGARHALLDALADVPGLTSAAHTLAALDAPVPGRQEAALATLEDAGGAEQAGPLGALTLVSGGHIERAREALVMTGAAEPFGPLAAQLFCRAAQLAEHPTARVMCLDRAVARAPQLASARWLRFEDRVRRGDLEGAVADAQHLEAASVGPSARHGVCLRAGRRLAEGGYTDAARRFLERALRYAPDDPAARAALGRLFATLGMKSRAVTLLQSALHSDQPPGEGGESDPGELLLDLARLLGDSLDDLPRAIGRLRQISARSPRAIEGRALEAEYCERLGDLTGASRAYARVREAVELGWARRRDALRALRRGAEFEERRGELAMAERHLYAALSLAPSDPDLRDAYRRVAALSSGRRDPAPGAPQGTVEGSGAQVE